jgi:DNA processing protein
MAAALPPSLIRRGDPGYPRGLEQLSDPPARLRVAGALPELPGVAIVGARAALAGSTTLARELGVGLARAGIAVVSGGALGVDTAAHEGALEASGATVAILGSALDRLYPERNLTLFARIAANGALLSELEPGTPPRRGNFPRRNRLIAALARAVVVVEAGPRSGALHTAAWARRLGVPLLAAASGAGARSLLGRGLAGELHDLEDLLSLLSGAPPRRARLEPVDPDAREALRALRPAGAATIDGIASALGWRIPRAAAALLRLELEGIARAAADGSYRLLALERGPSP